MCSRARTSMARRTVPTARCVSAVSSVSDGSFDVISAERIRCRRSAASWRYACSGEALSIFITLAALLSWRARVHASGAVSSPARRNHDQAIGCQFPVGVVNRPGGYAVVVSKLAHRGKLLAVLPIAGAEPPTTILTSPPPTPSTPPPHPPTTHASYTLL